MQNIKVGVIGGGSSYTPELIEGFIKRREEIPVRKIILMDVNAKRLDIVGGLARHMVRRASVPIEVEFTTDYDSALDGADFVVSQFRAGGLECRLKDETIPLEFGLVGQETTGPGGFAMALRSIPVALDIARRIERLSPNGWLINFTNPSGLVTEAIVHHSPVRVVGLCNGPITIQHRLAELLGVGWDHIRMDYFGLNHLSWVKRVYRDGEEVIEVILAKLKDPAVAARVTGYAFNQAVLQSLGMIPSGYLQYFYHTDLVLAKLASEPSRARKVMEIDSQLMELYCDPNLDEKPPILAERGGAWYSDAAVALISAIVNDKSEIHIVNMPNRGAVGGLPHSAVVEVPGVVNRSGINPIVVGDMPAAVRGLVHAVKAYEELTVKAAVQGSYQAALLALLAHPLVPSADVAERLLQRLIEANRGYWPVLK